MRYQIENVGYNGVKLKKTEGNIKDIYTTIETSLENLYKDSIIVLKKPSRPNFNDFGKGQTNLEPFSLAIKEDGGKETSHGHINVNYFKGQKNEKINDEADYSVSKLHSHTGGDVTYESITLFFNTMLPNISKDALKWSREAERDNFVLSIDDLM